MPDSTKVPAAQARPEPLLEICGLSVQFPGATAGSETLAVDGAGLELYRGETLALVGESGSGKSTLALAIPGLVDPAGRRLAGEIWFRGSDLTKLSGEELRGIRGKQIGMVFQDPGTALNPVLTIGTQIVEVLLLHLELAPAEARTRAKDLLARVGFSRPEVWMEAWPHQLSGGMLQRAMIAMAIAPGPRILIADEATAALDALVQVQILELLTGLCREQGMALLLVSHSLGLVASWADRVAVMVSGRVVERGPVGEVFRSPAHPYTRALFESEPQHTARGTRLPTMLPGHTGLSEHPAHPAAGGCFFRSRCTLAQDACVLEDPRLAPAPGPEDHAAACFFPAPAAEGTT